MLGPDSVNRRVSGPGTEPGSVPSLDRLKWAICKRGLSVDFPYTLTRACAFVYSTYLFKMAAELYKGVLFHQRHLSDSLATTSLSRS